MAGKNTAELSCIRSCICYGNHDPRGSFVRGKALPTGNLDEVGFLVIKHDFWLVESRCSYSSWYYYKLTFKRAAPFLVLIVVWKASLVKKKTRSVQSLFYTWMCLTVKHPGGLPMQAKQGIHALDHLFLNKDKMYRLEDCKNLAIKVNRNVWVITG